MKSKNAIQNDGNWFRYSVNWSKPLITAYKWKLLLLLIMSMLAVGLSLIKINFIQQSIDAVLLRDVSKLLQVCLLFAGITVLRLAQGYFFEQQHNRVFAQMEKDLKNRFVEKILRARVGGIEREKSGDLENKSNSDIPNALEFIKQVFSTFIIAPLMTIGGFCYLFSYSWKLSLSVFIPLPILVVLLNIMSNRASRIYKRTQELNSEYSEQIYDIIHGAATIKSYNMQQVQMSKVAQTLKAILAENRQYDFNIAITLGLILGVTYIPTVTAFIYGAYLVTSGEINVSLLFAYSQLIDHISAPVVHLFSTLISIKNAYQSMLRLDTVLGMTEERTGGNLVHTSGDIAVEFSKVKFGYDPEKPVCNQISFQIRKGQCIGLVGSSGAGKSTIVDLLCGIIDADEGRIEFFGQDSRHLSLESLRSQISYVPQHAYILPGTIAENIRLGNPGATEEAIQRSLEWAGLADYVATLPEGMHSILNEDGDNLSGGQRQRISLARAFLRSVPLYVFDEPTASLDAETEAHVVRKMVEIAHREGVTSIVISHNLAAIRHCDGLFYLEEGQITERGTFDELLHRKGTFYRQFQASLKEDEAI